ncbi:hypothetical protein [Streptomyces corynorhini]|uniref:hypothetical protein n=1 Tax=Streptomyces corynorhini TaxID=2282652 RepID=UPI00389A85A1
MHQEYTADAEHPGETRAEAQEILLQGWKPSTETQAECEASSPANGSVPDSEAIVRIPARMIPMIREACDAVERAQLR